MSVGGAKLASVVAPDIFRPLVPIMLWYVGAGMAVCNIAGAIVGARLALRGGSAFVRQAFIVIVSLLIVRTAWTAIGGK